MKTFLSVFSFLVMCSSLFGQTRLDSLVEKPKKIDPNLEHLIYEYRIPDWGYRRFTTSFTTRLYGQDRDSKDEDYNTKSFSGQIYPNFKLYKESEKSVLNITSMIRADYQYRKTEREENSGEQENKGDMKDIQLRIISDLNRYITRLFYLNLDLIDFFEYRESTQKEIYEDINGIIKSKSTSISRFYETDFRIGIGMGRVRNVNPVIRALRFDGRLRDINKSSDLNEGAIKELAYLYTRQPGYSSTYDRYKKYFYDALPASVVSEVNNLKPWEMLYLDEVFDEIIGDRYEGFELDGGLALHHEHSIYSNSTGEQELTLLGLYIEQEYYHNFTPAYQFGTNIYASYSKAVNENTTINYMGRGFIRFLNLWNLTDRLLVEFELAYETGFASIDEIYYTPVGLGTEEQWERRDRYNAYLSLNYFIENNLLIDATLSNDAYKNWPSDLSFEYDGRSFRSFNYDKEKMWNIRIGLRYYFLRGLY